MDTIDIVIAVIAITGIGVSLFLLFVVVLLMSGGE